MAIKGRRTARTAHAASATKRVTVTIDERTYRKAGAAAKIRGLALGDLVQAALDAHLCGSYWVERGDSQTQAPVTTAHAAATVPFAGPA